MAGEVRHLRYLCLTCGQIIHYGKKVRDQSCPCGNSVSVSGSIYVHSGNYTDLLILRGDELSGKKSIGISEPLRKIILRLNRTQTGKPSRPSVVLAWLDKVKASIERVAEVFGEDCTMIRHGPVIVDGCLAVDEELTFTELADDEPKRVD